MTLADAGGLEALTMRSLGKQLGVEAMSLYNHVPNKDALLDGMVEVILGELEIPSENGDWEERVRGGYRAFRRLAHEHPNVFPLLVNRPPRTMDGVWLVEEFLRTLREAGFDNRTALHAFRALSSYTFGYAMAEIRGFALELEGGGSGVQKIPPREFPRISELKPYLQLEPRAGVGRCGDGGEHLLGDAAGPPCRDHQGPQFTGEPRAS